MNLNGKSSARLDKGWACVAAAKQLCYSTFMCLRYLVLFFAIGSLPFISYAEGAVNSMALVMCKSQKIVRTIRVAPGGEGCQTIYTKSGVDKVVGGGKNQYSCLEVMKNIRTNLEGAAWKCRDISSSAVSDFAN